MVSQYNSRSAQSVFMAVVPLKINQPVFGREADMSKKYIPMYWMTMTMQKMERLF